ncbi:PAS domain S-box protein [Gloeothece verrucosa]|uniref:Circadian input-output histidine kinase CikA n=1 Tax=Gloeothece verrucosa (strain PCC 7822) TaxID=497965 RepID=E0UHW7_GLOV7|nr:PAS domain S-box protein [Gloeothece verrucosa]ADN14497.1 multi-sensor hybrid histidine kinase [Gloeothece verrucosa PCC 7822]
MSKRNCQAASLFVIGMGCLVLLGWYGNIPLLKSGLPGNSSTMKVNSAFCFLLLGVSLRLLQGRRIRRLGYRIAQTTALLVVMIGLLTLSEYFFNRDLGIDQLFFRDVGSVNTFYPGRMGVNTAINFILMGIALLWLRRNQPQEIWLAQIFSSVAAIISLLALLGHLFGVSVLAELIMYTTTQAPHTALTFLVLYGGILWAQPEQGLMQVITSPFIGGLMARQLIPGVIILPLILNGFALQGTKMGWYDLKAAFGIQITLTIVFFFALVWWNAYLLNKIESDRTLVQKALNQSQQQFQQAVEAANLGTWHWDVVTGKVILSPQGERLLNLKPGSFPGTYEAFVNLLHGDDFDALSNSLQVALLKASGWQMDHKILDPNGSWRWITSLGKFLYDKTGEPVQMIGIIKDITHRKQTEFNLQKLNETLEKRVTRRTAALKTINNQLKQQLLKCELIEEALKKSQARLSGILKIASDAIVSVDHQQKIILFNQEAEKVFGYSVKEVLGKPLSLLLPEKFQLKHHQWVNNFAQSGTLKRPMGKRLEIWGRRQDASEFPAEASISRLEIGGEIILTVILQDISERKQAQEQLNQINCALENAVEGISRLDTQGRYLMVNKAYAALLGYQPQEIIGKEWQITIHPSEQDKMKLAYQTMLTQGKVEAEVKGVRKDGSVFYKQVTMISAYDQQKQFIGHYCFAKDITERKQADEILKKYAQDFTDLYNHAPCGYHSLDENGLLVQINDTELNWLGYTREQLLGKVKFYELLTPESREVFSQNFERFKQRGWVKALEFELLRANGTVMPVMLNATAVKDSQGNYLISRSTIFDITKRKQAELELQKAQKEAIAANRAKSIFLANMSHELRTPLNAILGFTQLLGRDHCLRPEHLERLQIINRSGEHLLGLIDDILDLSKIETGKIAAFLTGFDLYHLLVTVEEMLQPKAKTRGLRLIIEKSFDLPQYIKTDEKKLRQVLINLLNNAIKFTQEGTVILRVKPKAAENTPQRLVFEVEDTGVGMAPDDIDQLFKVFVQAEAGKKLNQGTGLGLAISQKFVQLMGGEIEVKSTLGKGSVFSFEIEVELASGDYFQEELPAQKVVGLAPGQPIYRILIVEDVWESRRLLVELLSSVGFEVAEASNGAQALTLCESWSPHLIWMDMRMPVMNGYEATKLIKQHPFGQKTVIIALTASVFEDQRETIIAAGCDDIVSKPFTEAVIFKKLSQFLGVQYLYETVSITQNTPTLVEVSVHDLSIMSPQWLEQMYQAAYCLDADLIEELIEQIPSSAAALAHGLKQLVDNFKTERILELTRPLIAQSLE